MSINANNSLRITLFILRTQHHEYSNSLHRLLPSKIEEFKKKKQRTKTNDDY